MAIRFSYTTDAAGKKTTYSYNANTNVLEWVQYPEDTTATRTEYTYDNMYRMATASAATNTGLDLTASYVYNTDDTLKSITTGSTTYNFTYGNFALRSSVKAGTRTLATYTYTNDKNNYLQKLAYGNGDSVQYTYDKQGRVTKETYEDGSTVTYKYDNSGALATVTDSQSGITTTYYYDFIDRMMKYVEKGSGYNHSVGYEYDTINNLTKLVETINGSKYTSAYSYDDDNRITSVAEGTISDNYTYDSYGRLDKQIVKSGSTEVITNTYGYDGTITTTTGRINNKYIIANSFYANYTLVYDDNGNITKAIDGTVDSDYVYDTANQLVREDNFIKGFTHTWTYDDAGNILSRKEYAHTSATTLGTPTKTVTYTYANTDWGDLLTGYDGKTISYDTIGNPLTVTDASNNVIRSYTWQHGRQLASMTEDGTTWNYTYNADGLRTKRTNGSTTYQYVYNGDKLSQLTVAGHTLKFVYGSTGPVAVVYDGTPYYYVTNPQGDVTYIVDGTGKSVVCYSYDAWGNTSTTYDATTGLGTYNPLRYRGYVYDQETSLYYLQSRYYDPEIGRFLNADAYITTGQGFIGNNMFAYCGNNPISRVDISGNGWQAVVIGIAIGIVISVVTAWIGATVTGQNFTWRDVGVAALAGGISTLGVPGLVAGSLIKGGYSAYTAYENGADAIGIIIAGIFTSLFNMVSFGDLAKAENELLDIAVSGFVDMVFGTGFSSLDAAVSKTIVENNQKTAYSGRNVSAIDVAMRRTQNARTRIYNGQAITVGTKNCSYPGWYSNDPNRVYCYVQF